MVMEAVSSSLVPTYQTTRSRKLEDQYDLHRSGNLRSCTDIGTLDRAALLFCGCCCKNKLQSCRSAVSAYWWREASWSRGTGLSVGTDVEFPFHLGSPFVTLNVEWLLPPILRRRVAWYLVPNTWKEHAAFIFMVEESRMMEAVDTVEMLVTSYYTTRRQKMSLCIVSAMKISEFHMGIQGFLNKTWC